MMCALLNFICPEAVLVIYDYVVRGPHGALQASVCLQIEIKQKDIGYTLVNHCPGTSIPIPIRVRSVCGEEPSMVAFTADDNGQFGSIRRRSFFCVKPLEGIENLGEFLVDDRFELTL
jgi:hypothetical protein